MSSVALQRLPSCSGEEFRNDVRKQLTAEVLAPLTELSALRSTLAIAQTFASIAVVLACAVAFWSIPAAIVAIVLIAPLQHALFIIAHDAAHYRLYVVLWLVPLATGLQAILRLRAICEHGALSDFSSPLTAARTNLPNRWQRFLLFPHHVNYHIEHHLYPAVPHYNLPALHAALEQHGMLQDAEVHGLAETLPRIFAQPRAGAAA